MTVNVWLALRLSPAAFWAVTVRVNEDPTEEGLLGSMKIGLVPGTVESGVVPANPGMDHEPCVAFDVTMLQVVRTPREIEPGQSMLIDGAVAGGGAGGSGGPVTVKLWLAEASRPESSRTTADSVKVEPTEPGSVGSMNTGFDPGTVASDPLSNPGMFQDPLVALVETTSHTVRSPRAMLPGHEMLTVGTGAAA